MEKKIKITVTIDKPLFDSFKGALPDYISVSGMFETWIKEYMAGYYRFNWSLGEMIDVLRGKTTVDYLQKVHDLGLRGMNAQQINEQIELHKMGEYLDPYPKDKEPESVVQDSKSKKRKS